MSTNNMIAGAFLHISFLFVISVDKSNGLLFSIIFDGQNVLLFFVFLLNFLVDDKCCLYHRSPLHIL